MEQKNSIVPALFENAQQGWKVRIVDRGGEPWFIAKDVCACLGVDSGNLSKTLDDDEKGVVQYTTPGGIQSFVVTSEPGLYSLILRSRKPEAKAFRRWVTHEVLPSIRRTGAYGTPSVPIPAGLPNFEDPIEAAEAWVTAKKGEKAALEQAALAIEERDAQAARAEAQTERAFRAYGAKGGLTASRNYQKRRADMAEKKAAKAAAENEALKDQLGCGQTYSAVSAIPWIGEYLNVGRSGAWTKAGQELKAISDALGLPVRRIDHPKYGSVGAYHRDAVQAFRRRLDRDPAYLALYRTKKGRMALLDALG